jgi:hypothetical protein
MANYICRLETRGVLFFLIKGKKYIYLDALFQIKIHADNTLLAVQCNKNELILFFSFFSKRNEFYNLEPCTMIIKTLLHAILKSHSILCIFTFGICKKQ